MSTKKPVLAVAAIVIVVALYFIFSQTPIDKQVTEKTTKSGLEIAKEIYSYIGTQKNKDGFYAYASNCKGGCPFIDSVFKNANTWPVYASVGMYRATNDSKYLDAAKRDADTMIAWCAQDSRECVRVLYQIDALYSETGDKKYLDFINTETAALLSLPDEAETNFTMLIAIDSVELSDSYIWSGDSKALDSSIKKLSQAEALLANEKTLFEKDGNKYRTFSCWPQLARLELFKSTDDSKYLDGVKAFAANNIPGNLNIFWMMTDLQPCLDVYQSLYELTGDKSYNADAEKIAQHIITKYWDSSYSPKVSGNNAIKSNSDQSFSTITEASYMAYMLSRMEGSRFEVR
ncbi:MAG: hypothetical protein HZB68_03445 [Candidatus Aenigmarchaeota archaeon]|nr:hypothetical protein [Candidatus Aenigmarchaeota archaeon]